MPAGVAYKIHADGHSVPFIQAIMGDRKLVHQKALPWWSLYILLLLLAMCLHIDATEVIDKEYSMKTCPYRFNSNRVTNTSEQNFPQESRQLIHEAGQGVSKVQPDGSSMHQFKKSMRPSILNEFDRDLIYLSTFTLVVLPLVYKIWESFSSSVFPGLHLWIVTTVFLSSSLWLLRQWYLCYGTNGPNKPPNAFLTSYTLGFAPVSAACLLTLLYFKGDIGTFFQQTRDSVSTSPAFLFPLAKTISPGSLKGKVGLVNLGNSCYMNAGLQCLIHTNFIKSYPQTLIALIQDKMKFEGMERPKMTAALLNVVRKAWDPAGTTNAFAPKNFKYVLGQKDPQFDNQDQQDAHEALLHIFDALDMEEEKISSATGRPLFKEQFYGRSASVCQCQNCGALSINQEDSLGFSVTVPEVDPPPKGGKLSLDDCIDETFAVETISNFKCECGISNVKKAITYDPRASKYLIIHMKRSKWAMTNRAPYMTEFFNDKFTKADAVVVDKVEPSTGGNGHSEGEQIPEFQATKITSLVDFPLNGLDISRLNFKDDRRVEFPRERWTLYAIVNHQGPSMDSGHYTAFAKHQPSNEWFEFDDSTVSPVRDVSRLVTEQAYILFYERENFSGEI